MISRNYKKSRGHSHCKYSPFLRKILLVFCVFMVIAIVIYSIISPAIKKSLDVECRAIIIDTISSTCLKELKKLNYTYSDIVKIEYDQNKKINAIRTDAIKVNSIKSILEKAVTEALNDSSIQKMQIPLGTLLGSVFLAGRGPMIDVKIYKKGLMKSNINSEFIGYGINQTVHRVSLNLSAEITTIIPLNQADIAVNTNLLLAETTIVGEIPNYYMNIVGDSDITSDIKDNIIKPDFSKSN